MVLNLGNLVPQSSRVHLAASGHIFGYRNQWEVGEGDTDIQQLEAKDAAKHPPQDSTPAPRKDSSGPKCQ